MNTRFVMLVVPVPLEPAGLAEDIRRVLGEAGAGRIGNYDFCSFSYRGTGRFRGNEHSHQAVGEKGQHEAVEEERIEVRVDVRILHTVLADLRKVHPYEEIGYDLIPLMEPEDLQP